MSKKIALLTAPLLALLLLGVLLVLPAAAQDGAPNVETGQAASPEREVRPARIELAPVQRAPVAPQASYAPPFSAKVAPYKVPQGVVMSYQVLVTNTDTVTGYATSIYDALPSGVVQQGPATIMAIGPGVVVSGFGTTDPITWLGVIPPHEGVWLSIPVTVTAAPGEMITNTAVISDPALPAEVELVAWSEVYAPGELLYYESFTAGPGGLVGDNDWEWGIPNYVNGPLCHSQPACWGTVMAGDYSSVTVSTLTATLALPSILPTQTLGLQWWEWYMIEGTPWDYGLVFLNGSQIHLTEGYSGGWLEQEYDVTLYAGQTITLNFVLVADESYQYAGWYIDDLALHLRRGTPAFDGSYKTAAAYKVEPNSAFSYTIYIANSGRFTSTAGRMFDQLPPGLPIVAVDFVGGGAIVDVGNDYVEWGTSPIAPLGPGEDATIVIHTGVSDTLECGALIPPNTALVTDTEALEDVAIGTDPLTVVPVIYTAWNFEADDGGWVTYAITDVAPYSSTVSDWEWGVPTFPAGITAHSGQNVWATNLSGEYDDFKRSTLVYTLTLPSAPTGLFLNWWDVYIPWSGNDNGELYVDGQLLFTHNGSNWHPNWAEHGVDITQFAGQEVRIEWVMDGNNFSPTSHDAGWYLDDIVIHAGCPTLLGSSDAALLAACPNGQFAYTVDVENRQMVADTVTPTVEGAWPASVSPVSRILGAGERGTYTVTVDVPLAAAPTAQETFTTTFDSGSGLQSDDMLVGGAAAPTWELRAPVPNPRLDHGVVAVGDYIYLLGGYDSPAGGTVYAVDRYDPAADSWAAMAPMPGGVPYGGDAVADDAGNIYISSEGLGAPGQTMFVYSTTADLWMTRTIPVVVPDRSLGYEMVYLDGYIYRLGGGDPLNGHAATSNVYRYDPDTDTWIEVASMNEGRRFHSAWVYDGQIYVAGGLSAASADLTSTEVYSPAINTWLGSATSGFDPLPFTWWGAGDAVKVVGDDTRLYIMAGVADGGVFLSDFTYALYWSTQLGQWVYDPALAAPPFATAWIYRTEADTLNGEVYMVSGSDLLLSFTGAVDNQRHVQCYADLAVEKVGPEQIAGAGEYTYIITVTNNGPDAAVNVLVGDLLPDGVTFVTSTLGLPLETPTYTIGTDPLADWFWYGNLAAGADAVVTLIGSVAVAPTETLTNTAYAQSGDPLYWYSSEDVDRSDNVGYWASGAEVEYLVYMPIFVMNYPAP